MTTTRQRTADFIAGRLARLGIRHVFLVTGGGAMHLNDAFGRVRGMTPVCLHHEQACAMAAESYCRLSGVPAVVNVTTGPGGINALNGVFGAYTDSIAMVVVSGQVKRETMAARHAQLGLRQLGDQEVNIVAMAAPVTKYAVVLDDPADAMTVVDRAFYLATRGRPGPVWIDVPSDVQGAPIEADVDAPFDESAIGESLATASDLRGVSPTVRNEVAPLTGRTLTVALELVLQRLRAAARPVILAGGGVRISGAHALFLALIRRLGIPVVTGWNAHDVLGDEDARFVGRPGTVGDRAGNFAVQNADFLLVLGCRMNIRQISYNWKSLAPDAWKAMVDIDAAELAKPTLSIDAPIHADLGTTIELLLHELVHHVVPAAHRDYLAWCRDCRARYPVVLPSYRPQGKDGGGSINPYWFVERLFANLTSDDIIVTGDGTACVVTFQAATLKQGQRLYTNSGSASMGYDLPAAIGACVAAGGRRVVCIAGDGSVMMNLQELQSIAGMGLPVKIFIINNDGYHSIRQTQNAYFPGNEIGVGPQSGLSFPDFVVLAQAFGIGARRVADAALLDASLVATLDEPGPCLCEVVVDVRQGFAPKLASRRLDDGTMESPALDDMFPFLPREELAAHRLSGAGETAAASS